MAQIRPICGFDATFYFLEEDLENYKIMAGQVGDREDPAVRHRIYDVIDAEVKCRRCVPHKELRSRDQEIAKLKAQFSEREKSPQNPNQKPQANQFRTWGEYQKAITVH
jgi:hypothetical protein